MDVTFVPTATGFIVNADGVQYLMEWVNNMLKVTGPDICYYILETTRGIEKANCALDTFNILISSI
jgi:hypothetical protein